MARTLIGIVYDRHTLVAQRIVVPDDDSHLLDGRHIAGPQEAMTTIAISFAAAAYPDPESAAAAAIQIATGRLPPQRADIVAADAAAKAAGVPIR